MPKKKTTPATTKKKKATDAQVQEPQQWEVQETDMLHESLLEQISQLTKKLTDQEEITKKAQSDYVRQRLEFDEYMTRAEAQKKTSEVDGLIKACTKILPVVNQLKQMSDTVPEDLTWNSRVEWVQLMYKKSLADIELLGVTPIACEVWADVDYTSHMPIGMEEVEDEALKNKIIKEIEPWYMYKKWDIQKVVVPAKVMVGA